SHSFACEADRHAVFLNLKRDKYVTVSPEDVAALRETVRGWTSLQNPDVDLTSGIYSSQVTEISSGEIGADGPIDALVKEGFLTADGATGKEASRAQLPRATSSFVAAPRSWPTITRQHLWNFVRAWARATIALRTLPIGWVVEYVRRRK